MDNQENFKRLSDFIAGIIDPKIVSLAKGITSSTGYLKGLVADALTYSQDAQTAATNAQGYAAAADTSASSALIVYNNFTSTWLGVQSADPQQSSTGNPVDVDAIYVNSGTGRLRYAASVTNGVVTWADALVAADPASVVSAATGKFLSLSLMSLQTVSGPVGFSSVVTVPHVTNWNSMQAAPASDINSLITNLQNALSLETQRAEAAEQNLTNTKIGVVQSNLTQNGGFRVYSDGLKECWGTFIIAGNGATVNVNLPVGHTQWSNMVIGACISHGANARNNTGIYAAPTNINTWTFLNEETSNIQVWWQSKGV